MNKIDSIRVVETQVVIGQMKCAGAGIAYTISMTGIGAAVGGLIGGITGGTVGGIAGAIWGLRSDDGPAQSAYSGGALGTKYGSLSGAALGGGIGFGDGVNYTTKLYCRYSKNHKSEDTKKILQQFFSNFYHSRNEEIGEEDKPRIICPVSFEVMLYPAKIVHCTKRHLYELSVFHDLLERNNGVCPECRVRFNAKDLRLDYETQDVIIKICLQAFDYLTAKTENRLLIEQLNKDIGNRIQDIRGYIQNHPLTPLSSEIERKIAEGESLPTEAILTIYPAFRKICLELNEANKEMKYALMKAIDKQLENQMIDEDQYKEKTNQILEFAEKNRMLFNAVK